ncbi:MAG TPA: hypothetical protein GX709_02625 [Clostridiales bacterium]|nr:hypothetical protein [Clostridiales bacterium]
MQQKNTLDILNELIVSFYSSRLIIVDKVISKFLKTLVENKELFEILSDCVNAYDYETEYQNALTTTDNKTTFLLPRSRRKTIALVSGLLFEFDNKSKNIIDFVTTFFPAETSHESYIKFLDNIITPFADSFAMLLTTNYDLPEIKPETQNEIFPDAAKEQCTYWLTQLSDSIISSNKIDEQTRNDALELIKGMFHMMEMQNPTFIKYVWIGLKNTLKSEKSCTREIQEINTVLYNYAVIN